MSWSAVAGVIGGVYNAWQSRDADTAARESNERAMDLAIKQYDYQLHNVGMFQDTLRANIGVASGMDFGAGFDPMVANTYSAHTYSADLLDPNKYTNQEGIAVAQGMMDDWESTFGGLEENLSDYFNNLDPDKYATESKAMLQQNIDKSMTQFNDTMAASGLQSSGMKQQAAKEAAFMQATGNAQIDASAEDVVAQQQMGFLAYGQNEKMQASSLLSQSTNIGEQMKWNASAANQQATNQASAFNASAINQASAFNANSMNSAAQFNLSNSIRAEQMQDTAVLGAYNNFANSYLTKANIVDPRIAIETGNASNSAASSAGYATAAGTALGVGIKALDYGGVSDFSDVRLKKNIHKIGTHNGHNVYSWEWNDDAKDLVGDQGTVGHLAQEVRYSRPDAISRHESGYLMINYGML